MMAPKVDENMRGKDLGRKGWAWGAVAAPPTP